jgi:hypothetical protein
MSDNLTTNVPNSSKNEDFIQAIKNKYSSLSRAAPLPQTSQRQFTNALPERFEFPHSGLSLSSNHSPVSIAPS